MTKPVAAEAGKSVSGHKMLEEHSKFYRDVLLGFVKVHVLQQAELEPVYGVGILEELARHGYNLSPGTLYPMLQNMAATNFLEREDRTVGGKLRKYYRITPVGREALQELREKVGDLIDAVLPAQPRRRSG